MKNSHLYDWLFHYNPHTDEWNTFKREDYLKYCNGTLDKTELIKSKSIKTIISYLDETNKGTKA